MGATTSVVHEPGQNEILHYLDIEGGVREGNAVWDIALVAATAGTATRWFSMTNDRARKMLLRSLPEQWRTKVAQHGEAVQRVLYDNEQNVIDHRVCSGGMAEEVGAYLRGKQRNGGIVIAAWGMDTHDARILRRLVGDDLLDDTGITLVDALKRMRAAWSLPKYTLGSEAAGTPRSVFNAGKYPGPSHTAYKDALCLRDVVRNSVLELPDAPCEVEFLCMGDERTDAPRKHGKVKELQTPARDMGADRPSADDIARYIEQPKWWSMKQPGRLTEDKCLRCELKRSARKFMGEDWSKRNGPALNRAMQRHALFEVLARA